MPDPRIEELLKEARRASKIDRERIEFFESMIRTPAWLAYMELLEAKIQMLADEILGPARSVDGMVALEYLKGTMSGLVIARDIPSVTIAAKDQIRQQPVELDAEWDNDEPA
jgi:hypothetical protein